MSKTAILLIAALAAASVCASAETRRALVIGNDSYPGNALENARNDARAVYDALKSKGYVSTLVLDADRSTLSRKVDDFVDTIHTGDTAVLYYAGHGLQVDGENFLVPVNFHLTSPESAKTEGYSLSSVLDRFTEHQATTQIVILDACRDNPFLGNRSYKGGWAGIGTSAGAFIAFGTSPGSTASDAPGEGHGLFTKALLRYLTNSDLDIEEMFRKVRQDVIQQSGGQQVPWISSSLIGSFHVRPELDAKEPMLVGTVSGTNIEAAQADGRSLHLEPTQRVGDTNRTLVNPTNDFPQQAEQLALAATFVRGAKFDDAITTLRSLLTANPGCGLALRLLGLVLHLTGRDLEGIATFDRALAIDPHDSRAAAYKCAVEAASSIPSTLGDCDAALRTDTSLDGYLALGAAQLSVGEDDLAYASASRAISLGGSDLAYALRGAVMSGQGEKEAAQRDYSRAVGLVTESLTK